MTGAHPDAAHLLALVDGELDPELTAVVAAHVHACAACQRAVADLRALEGTLAGGGVTPRSDGPSAELAARMQRAARLTLTPVRRGRSLRWGLAAAALVLLWVGFALTRDPPPLLSATMAWTRSEGARRGSDDRLHFELRLPAPGEVTIFVVPTTGPVRLLFPADDAIVARLAMPLRLPAGELRLPIDPLFDFEPIVPSPSACVVVLSPGTPASGERENWRQQLEAVVGPEAARMERLARAARAFGGVVCGWPED